MCLKKISSVSYKYRQPIPVDLKGELDRAISSTYMKQNSGTCTCSFIRPTSFYFTSQPRPDYNVSAKRNSSAFWLTVAFQFKQWTSAGGTQWQHRFSSESWPRLQFPNRCISGICSCKSLHDKVIATSLQTVENTLFQVLGNGFNVPGTPFEEIFALRDTLTDSIEESSHGLENPIQLPGIKADHFRSFLHMLYPLCVLMILSVKYFHCMLIIN